MSAVQIDYNDEVKLRVVLVGRQIVETRKATVVDAYGPTLDTIQFVLDNGVVLEAREADGGCACSNGCWSVENPATTTQVITNVEVVDETNGDDFDAEATLRMFVYADQIKTELVRSEGGDNGYYGWGYHVLVHEQKADT